MIGILLALQATVGGDLLADAKTYVGCSASEAKRLEKSGEPAAVIADVVVSKCEPYIRRAADAVIADFKNRPEVGAFEEKEGKPFTNYERQRESTLDGLRSTARKVALERVVELRSSRVK